MKQTKDKSYPQYWQTKEFSKLDDFHAWIWENGACCNWHEVFINNAYGVEFRAFKTI